MDLRSMIGSTRNGRFLVRSSRLDRAAHCSVGFSQTHDIVVAVLFPPTGGNVPFDRRTRQARLTGWARVDLVYLVCLVHLVSLVQPNRPNKQERPADPRASRATVCGAGGLSQHSAHTRSPTSNSAGSITSEPGKNAKSELLRSHLHSRCKPQDHSCRCSKNRPECPHCTSSGRLWHRGAPH